MTRPLLLDLFCGAGGAAAGYHAAGFDVLGVDINPQPNYPYEFQQADAIEWLQAMVDRPWAQFPDRVAAVHASPPCQRHSKLSKGTHSGRYDHPDLIGPTRTLLQRFGRPWVIENVIGSPLRAPFTLCGEMFGLQVIRHRLFESSHLIMAPEHPAHRGLVRGRENRGRPGAYYYGVWGHGGGDDGGLAQWSQAMGIDWMTKRELVESIPPAFTEYIGRQLLPATWSTVDHHQTGRQA